MPTRSPPRFTPRRLLAVFWTLAIVVALSLPGSSVPGQNWIAFDKVAHALMFLGFGVLWMSTLRRSLEARAAWVLVFGLAFAGLTEMYQGFLPFDRTPNLLDALAGAAGLVLGVGCFFVQRRLR